MRAALLIGMAFCLSVPAFAQDGDTALRTQLEALHARWFNAFESGDGAAMDQMETPNLVLVMPSGTIWPKSPRVGKQEKSQGVEHSLSDVSMRRFGDSAIITGILSTKDSKGVRKEATTVVFVNDAGTWKIASAQWTSVAK